MTTTTITPSEPTGTEPTERWNVRFWKGNDLLLHTRITDYNHLQDWFCFASDRIYKPDYGFIDVVITEQLWRITKFI